MNTPKGILRGHQSEVNFIYRVLDAITISVGLYLTNSLRGIPSADIYVLTAFLGAVVFYVLAEANHLYGSWRTATVKDSSWRLISCWLITVFVLLSLGYATKRTDYLSRISLGIWVLSVPVALVGWRIIVFKILRHLREKGYNSRIVAIAGVCEKGKELAKLITDNPSAGMDLVGFYAGPADSDDQSGAEPGPPVLGDLHDLVSEARAGRLDIIYIAVPIDKEEYSRLLFELSDTTVSVYVVPDLFTFGLLQSRWTTVGPMPVISVFESPFLGIDGWAKRIEDILVSIVVLVVMAIPAMFIAIGIKLTSPGPVIFKQNRYGLYGANIKVWKFRTMYVSGNEDTFVQAAKDDARVTRFGGILRRTSLDELPQFLNVLAGEMSVVGPRPHAVAQNEDYRRQIMGYMLRYKVKPGITGWAQVNGWRGETDCQEKMRKRVEHDLWYIQSWSIWLDLQIILRTIVVVLQRKNAY